MNKEIAARPEWEKLQRFEDGTWYENAGAVLGNIDNTLAALVDGVEEVSAPHLVQTLEIWMEHASPTNRTLAVLALRAVRDCIEADVAVGQGPDATRHGHVRRRVAAKARDALELACRRALGSLRRSYASIAAIAGLPG